MEHPSQQEKVRVSEKANDMKVNGLLNYAAVHISTQVRRELKVIIIIILIIIITITII
jgi:hypothetical protein